MQRTEEKTRARGLKYKRWSWKELGDTFGFYLFWDFNLDHVAVQVYSFLAKYYLWQIMEHTDNYNIFLDADRTLTDDMIDYARVAREDVILGPNYNPYFAACKSTRAAAVANRQIRNDLDLRYRVLGDKMFDFFWKNSPNILGRKFIYCTMVPVWRMSGIYVTNTAILAGTETEAPITNFVPAIYPKYNNPLLRTASATASTSTETAVTVTPKRKSINAISCTLPGTTRRIIVVGDDCTGITDLKTFAVADDAVIHTNACRYLSHTGANANITNIIYYDKASYLPDGVTKNESVLKASRQIYPSSTFEGFEWKKKVSSEIASSVALACSYKEKHMDTPVVLYGHNVADDASNGNDSELEDVLLKDHDIKVFSPTYEVLYLVLTSFRRKLRWFNAESTWCKKMENTHHTWRFAYASKNKTASKIDNAWAIPVVEDVDVAPKSFYAALRNAARMNFKYIYICKDLAEPDPLDIWSVLLHDVHKCIGYREYDNVTELLYFNLAKGACLNRETFEACLINMDLADETTIDLALARALKRSNIALEALTV